MGFAKLKDVEEGSGQPPDVTDPETMTSRPSQAPLPGPPPLYFLKGDHKQYPWSTLPWKGITKKTLFFDPVGGSTLELTKFEQGASFPAHHLTCLQATYVLKGHLKMEPGSTLTEGSFYISEAGEIQASVIADAETILYRYFAGVPVFILSDGSTFITRRDGSVAAAGRIDLLRKKHSSNLVAP